MAGATVREIQAADPSHIFELQCCHDQPIVRCVMFRNTYRSLAEDDFSVYAVEDGRWLGCEDTKDDAVFSAILTLGDEHSARLREEVAVR